MFCKECGNEMPASAAICMKCGVPSGNGFVAATTSAKSRVAFILLGFFLGGFGIHNFYAGYVGKGIAQLLITLLGAWLIVPWIAVGIWILVELCTVKQDARGVPFI